MKEDLQEILLTENQIRARIIEMGREVTEYYRDKNLYLVLIMRGAGFFGVDLSRAIDLKPIIGHITIQTWGGEKEAQREPEITHVECPMIKGSDILIVDDICDSGKTAQCAIVWANSVGRSVRTCFLLQKDGIDAVIRPDYVGFDIPNVFVIGWGLDYKERYRNLMCIGVPRDLTVS